MSYSGFYRTTNGSEENEVDNSGSEEESSDSGEENQSYYTSSSISGVHISQMKKKNSKVNILEDEETERKKRITNPSRNLSRKPSIKKSLSIKQENKPVSNEPNATRKTPNVIYGPDTGESDDDYEERENSDEDTSQNISYSPDDSNTTNLSYGVDSTNNTIKNRLPTQTRIPPRPFLKKSLESDSSSENISYGSSNENISYGVDSSGESSENIAYSVDTDDNNQNIMYGVENTADSKNISYGVDTDNAQNISYGVDTSIQEKSKEKKIPKLVRTKTKPKDIKENIITHPTGGNENISYGVDSSNNNEQNTSYGVEPNSTNINEATKKKSKDEPKKKGSRRGPTSRSRADHQNISYNAESNSSQQNISYGVDQSANTGEKEEKLKRKTKKKVKEENGDSPNNKRSRRRKRSESGENTDPRFTHQSSNPALSLAESAELKLLGGRSRSIVVLDPSDLKVESPKRVEKEKVTKTDKLGMKECHWNTEFQIAVDMPEGKEKWEKLAHLARDFVYCSKTYGKIIISEYYLPEEEKTIKSCDAGGVAGGSKYICSNIFFKFALDTDLLAGTRAAKGLDETKLPPLWMYGGSERNDYAAMKSSKNDMIGLMSYYNSKILGLCFPLMSLIDYRGFRLIAMSILPITKGSIKYGSADGGKVVHKDIKELNKKMKEVAERLNLKGHKTGLQKVTIYGPGDIEGHLGKDDKFYVLDFGRVFPPEAPDPPGSRKIFYCLLRPEFVRAYQTALSSDAFSCWGKIGGAEHNAEVIEATKYLHEQIIPKFAIELSQRENESEIRLTELLHANGINCRHFGRVRKAVPLQFPRIQQLLLNEMLGRTLTAVLRQLLRFEMQKTQIASQEPYKILVLDFFNALLLPPRPSYSKDYSSSKSTNYKIPALKDVDSTLYLLYPKFWTRDIKYWFNDKFEHGLREEEMSPDYDLRNGFDMEKLIIRICSQSGIKLSKHALAEYRNSRENFKLLNFDLKKMSAKVRHLNVIDEAEGNLLYIEASSAQGRSGLWEATNQMYARAVSSNTNNPQAYVRWGTILMEQAGRIVNDNIEQYEKILESARDKFQAALKIDNKMPFAYFELAITVLEQAVCMQLFRSGDTIAISLWMIVQAQEFLRKAFFTENASRSLLFPTLLERADEIYQQAKVAAEKSIIRANILYLKAFYMIHCAIATAPFIPEPSVFIAAAVIIIDFLTVSSKCPKFLYGLAGSYLESAFLTHPSASDGEVIYYQTKANYQRKITNTSEILPNYYDNKRDLESNNDIVLIYERKTGSSVDTSMCYYTTNEEIPLPKDTPLHMLPVITRDPVNDYHGTIGINRILHVLTNDTVTSNLDFCAYNVFTGNNQGTKLLEEDNTSYSFYKTSWLFLLNHSGFHQFLLTHIHIKYPALKQTDNEASPKQIKLYGSNSEDIIYCTTEEIQSRINSDNLKNDSNIFFIFSAEVDSTLGVFESRIRQNTPAKYLILEFVPPSNTVKNLTLSSISLRGHQCYTIERKDVPLNSEDMIKLKPKLKTSKEGLAATMNLQALMSPSMLNLKSGESSKSLIDESDPNPNTKPVTKKNGVVWSDKRHSPRLTIGEEGRIVKLIHKRFILKHEKGVPLNPDCPHVSQADKPLDLKQFDEKGVNTSLPITSSTGDSTAVTDLCPMVLWVDENHNSPQNKTLYTDAKAKCANLIIVKVNSLSHAKKWVSTQIDYNSVSTKVVQKLIRKNIFRVIVSQSLPAEEGPCSGEHFIEWLKQTLQPNDWAVIPVLLITPDANHPIQNKEEKVYATSSSETISAFLCYDPEFFTKFNAAKWSKSVPGNKSLSHSLSAQNPVATTIIDNSVNNNEISSESSTEISIGEPLQANPDDFLYFEIRIIGIEKGGTIAIGLANRSFPLHGSMPGTLPDSLSYHSDNGLLYCGNSYKPYHFSNGLAHPFTDGDVIGCGFNTRSHQVFWTKNGKYLGTAEQSRSKFAYLTGLKLFPTVGITKGGIFAANFGSEPFLFMYSKLFEEQYNQSRPKQMTSDQKIAEIFPYSENLFEHALKYHGDSLLIISTLARYSRSFNILLRSHFRFQRSRQLRFTDSKVSYLSISLKNSELANNLAITYLFFLLQEPKYVNFHSCTKITDELFSVIQSPQSVEELNLSGLTLTDNAVTFIEERFVNLSSIHLWPNISERGILSLTSFSTLTSINLSDCKNVNDSILNSILKPQRNRYLISLNVTNCVEITDKSISHLYKSTSANYLQTLVLDYCYKISNASLLKVIKACVSLQNFSIASNTHECNITENTVIELATLRAPIIKSLNFSRCDKVTTNALSAIGKHCANLSELNISHCKQIQSVAIADIAKGCTKLVHLDLCNTNLTDEILAMFCKSSPGLRYLSLQRTNISAKLVIPCFKYLSKLETLILKENSLSDNLLLSIANFALPNLAYLDISSCPTNLSTDTLKFLKARRPSVKIVSEKFS